jgi:hypothetical protein
MILFVTILLAGLGTHVNAFATMISSNNNEAYPLHESSSGHYKKASHLMRLRMMMSPSSLDHITIESPPRSPLRLSVLVEPSPFTYVCGYSNRYQALFRYLQQQQDQQDVEIITVEVVAKDRPTKAFGVFPIHYTRGVPLICYRRMSVSIDWTLQVIRKIRRCRPHLIHCSSP